MGGISSGGRGIGAGVTSLDGRGQMTGAGNIGISGRGGRANQTTPGWVMQKPIGICGKSPMGPGVQSPRVGMRLGVLSLGRHTTRREAPVVLLCEICRHRRNCGISPAPLINISCSL